MSTFCLAVTPAPERFSRKISATAEQDLEKSLQAQTKDTRVVPVRHQRELFLDGKAVNTRGYHYTNTALSQLCRALSPGLFELLGSLCDDRQRTFDQQLAIRFLNDMVKLRFSLLADKVLVLNTRRRQIDGLVTQRYARLANSDLFEQCRTFVRQAGVAVEFDEAVLSGRRLVVQYRGRNPLFEVPTERKTLEPFFGGYRFVNSEVGDRSIMATTLIIRQCNDARALGGMVEGGRVVHVKGPKFEAKLGKLFDKVQKRALAATTLKDNVLEMIATPLGMGGDPEQHAGRIKQLVSRLRRAGLPLNVAERAVVHALFVGSYGQAHRNESRPLQQVIQPQPQFAKRNVFDLFNALTLVVKQDSLQLQDQAEELAYAMLIGKFTLN